MTCSVSARQAVSLAGLWLARAQTAAGPWQVADFAAVLGVCGECPGRSRSASIAEDF